MAKNEGNEKEVTFYKGTPKEKTVTLRETENHEYTGAHRGTHGTYGVAAVTQKLKGLDFPASRQEVIERLEGDVQWSKDRTINVRELAKNLPNRFERPTDVVQAISDNLEERETER